MDDLFVSFAAARIKESVALFQMDPRFSTKQKTTSFTFFPEINNRDVVGSLFRALIHPK